MLAEERKQSQEVVKQSVAATREEMKEYLKEQRKVSEQFLFSLSIKIPAKQMIFTDHFFPAQETI